MDAEGIGWARQCLWHPDSRPELTSEISHWSLNQILGMPFFTLSQVLPSSPTPSPHGGWSSAYRTHLCSALLLEGLDELSGHLSPAPVSLNAESCFLSTVAGFPPKPYCLFGQEHLWLTSLNIHIWSTSIRTHLPPPSGATTSSEDQRWDR